MRTAVLSALLSLSAALPALAATPVATYEFGNTFAALEPGVPAAVPTDPLGLSSFQTDTVLGGPRTVWAFRGTTTPGEQAGLTINTTGLVSPQSYSVDMVFEFVDRPTGYRRVLDVQNRQSDQGFYVDPGSNLSVYPVAGFSAGWSNGVYHHVVFTDDGTTVSAYLDGISQFSAPTTIMNLDADPTDNPSQLLGVFLDNVINGGQGEWSSGKVSLVRLWDGVLTADEAQRLALNPFVPEPAALSAACGLAVLLTRRRR